MKYLLAPMAGFTDAPFRRMCTEGMADWCGAEMVSAAALAHGHRATRQLLETLPGEAPVACQVFGADAGELAAAAGELSALGGPDGRPRFCEVNLNAGCPMPNVTRSGGGARLVADPDKVFRLLSAMVAASSLPVTLKTRIGPHPGAVTAYELVDAAERAGAASVLLHARFTSQLHTGAPALDILAEAVRRARIPVYGNGGVTGVESAGAMAATGVAGIAIGRAALADPAIFARLRGSVVGDGPAALVRRHLQAIVEFHAQLARNLPDSRLPPLDDFVALKARTQLFRYFAGRPGAAALRARFNRVQTLADLESILSENNNAHPL